MPVRDEDASSASAEPGRVDPDLRKARELEVLGASADAARTYQCWAEDHPARSNLLEAAVACERLGQLGRAEFLFNTVKSKFGDDAQANEGLNRIRRAKGMKTPGVPAAVETPHIGLARKKLEAGHFDVGLGYLTAQAEQVGTADAFVEVARTCEEHQQNKSALLFYERALKIDPAHSEAADGVSRMQTATQQPRAALREIARLVEVKAPDRAVDMAREYLAQAPDHRFTTLVVALLRTAGVGHHIEALLPKEGTARAMARWLIGADTLDVAVVGGITREAAMYWAGRLALHEHRWQEACELLRDRAGAELALALFRCNRTEEVQAALPGVEVAGEEALQEIRLPDVRPVTVDGIPRNLLPILDKAWESYLGGDLDDAAFRFGLAGQSQQVQVATAARRNEAVIRLALGDIPRAEAILIELRSRAPRDASILWLHSLSAFRCGHMNDALNAIKALLEIDHLHRQGRVLAAVAMVRSAEYAKAATILTQCPECYADPAAATLAVAAAAKAQDARLLSAVLGQLEAALALRVPGIKASRAEPPCNTRSAPAGPSANPRPRLAQGRFAKLEAKARSLQSQQGMGAAVAYLQSYLRNYPKYVPTHRLIGRFLAEAGRLAESGAAWERAATLSTPGMVGQTLSNALDCLLAAGAFEEALAMLKNLHRKQIVIGSTLLPLLSNWANRDDSGKTRLLLAAVLHELGHEDRARKEFSRVGETTSWNPSLFLAFAKLAPKLEGKPKLRPDWVKREWEKLCRRGLGQQGLDLVRLQRQQHPSSVDLERLEIDAL